MTPFEKADRAKQLLDDQLLREVLTNIREGIVRRVEASPMGDVDTHHHAALSLQLLKQITAEFHKYIAESTVLESKTKHESWLKQKLESARKLYA